MTEQTRREPAPLRHVVAATDFSEPAAAGVAWARDVARVHGAELHLVHAVYQLEPGLVGMEPPISLTEEARKVSEERLDEMARELSAEGVPTRYIADFGQPSQVIRRVAEPVVRPDREVP